MESPCHAACNIGSDSVLMQLRIRVARLERPRNLNAGATRGGFEFLLSNCKHTTQIVSSAPPKFSICSWISFDAS